MKRTYQPNKRSRAKKLGFLSRHPKVIARRRHKGRVRLGI